MRILNYLLTNHEELPVGCKQTANILNILTISQDSLKFFSII